MSTLLSKLSMLACCLIDGYPVVLTPVHPVGYLVYAMKLEDWPTKEPAAKQIGVSIKTLERMADAGKIEQRMRPRPGGTPVAVFNPADVERAAAERARAFVMPAGSDAPTASGMAIVPITGNTAVDPTSSFVQQVAEAIAAAVKPDALHVSPADKVRVTMKEAVALGFTRDYLRDQMQAGKLENVGNPRRHRFRKRDLDAL